MFDVSTGQSSQVAAHDAPVKGVRFVDQQGGILATGSWDKTLKVSDCDALVLTRAMMRLTNG